MNTEPVLILAAVNALIALAVGFGLHITVAQGSLIDAAVTAILALVLRSQVTPTGTLPDLSKTGKTVLLVASLGLAGMTLSSCAPPVTITTPQGKIAYTADQIVVRVNELQNAAIAANAATPPGLSTSTTRILVTFCVDADKTLAATPAGWQATLQQAWIVAKQQAGIQSNPAVIAAMSAVDIVLGVIQ